MTNTGRAGDMSILDQLKAGCRRSVWLTNNWNHIKNSATFSINTLGPRQHRHRFVDDIFKCIFFNENCCVLIKTSFKYVCKGPIDNTPVLVQIMAWRRLGDKSFSEPVMVSLPTHICVARPQWVSNTILKINWHLKMVLHRNISHYRLHWLFTIYFMVNSSISPPKHIGKKTIVLQNVSPGLDKGLGPEFNIKMLSHQYRKSHCGDNIVIRLSYLHNGISYSGKIVSGPK